ncbi:MAG: uroporphyrinogen-III synthase [Pyrinomonadaceae bacterium]|nr:uroporphyrinogen-III synthase [Pyrinomonadaceae bacterium]
MNKITYGFFASGTNPQIFNRLLENGADLHEFPKFSTASIAVEDDVIANLLDRFDWIIVSDVLSAEHFLLSLEASGFDHLMLDSVRICAVGEAASDVLRYSQIHSDVILPFPHAKDAVIPLMEYIGRERFAENRFLSLGGKNSKNILAEEIEISGGQVERIEVYEVSELFIENAGRSAALLSGGAIDRFIICTPGDVVALHLILERSKLNLINLEIEILVTGPAEFRSAAEAGLKPSYLTK